MFEDLLAKTSLVRDNVMDNVIDNAKGLFCNGENKRIKGEVSELKKELMELVAGMDQFLHPNDPASKY
ncbi:hypothetical protein GLAREA_09444 [Glarea lozoyensis ATCC 20868]|uniref:Uncharacterized protein n=1 Tax=Glarea lozoyensis (strain ATCC 20868 / MF5171) TaxID=1116229 RepID=S3CTH7_GLAL2|nr:uncharacterized protein GLAREA_09444 [Glarea lozoyensis ATCC 20868]EPE28324.1 hypothetical protein GLAREA_09444 [Glarea lozoyensis ATCC 20868]